MVVKARFRIAVGEQVAIEKKVKQILTANGAPVMFNHFYMNFGKKLLSLKKRYSADTFINEACIEAAKWLNRELDFNILKQILNIFMAKVCAPSDAYYVLTQASADLANGRIHPNTGAPLFNINHDIGADDFLTTGNLYVTDIYCADDAQIDDDLTIGGVFYGDSLVLNYVSPFNSWVSLSGSGRRLDGYYYGDNSFAGAVYVGRKGRGTSANPDVPNLDDNIVNFQAQIIDAFGSSTWRLSGRAGFKVDSAAISTTDWGTRYTIELCNAGSKVLTEWYAFHGGFFHNKTGDMRLNNNIASTGDSQITDDGTDLILNPDLNAAGGRYVIIRGSKSTTGDPGGEEGKIYINTFDNVLKMYCDGAWRTLASW